MSSSSACRPTLAMLLLLHGAHLLAVERRGTPLASTPLAVARQATKVVTFSWFSSLFPCSASGNNAASLLGEGIKQAATCGSAEADLAYLAYSLQ